MRLNGYRFGTECGDVPVKGYEPSLFHLPEHLRLQTNQICSFFVVHESSKKRCAEVHFQLENGLAKSHRYAPFGSFLISTDLPAAITDRFIEYCEASLYQQGVHQIQLVHAPGIYYESAYAVLHPLLLHRGYVLTTAEISALVPVQHHDFQQGLHNWERRKLRQAKQAGLLAVKLPPEELKTVYDFLTLCREQKNYRLSLAFEEVQQLAQTFSDRLHLFAVYHTNRMAAAALCLSINRNVLYAFYYDHHAEFDGVSPVVLLMEHIHQWCAKNDFRILDLGTSSAKTGVNYPLLAFKLHLGAVPSPKYTFQKKLA
ncbi:MAG: hypothetical protein KatS3mg032_1313 [Cyclobacteriaceae bacterium]|nr:MAG: hypothetical protein KatS3mg032_1313 [Cyclobacteriaceae bacterium]